MSTRNKARKSTGPRSATRLSNANVQPLSTRASNLRNSGARSTQQNRSSSSDCDTPTQILRSQKKNSQVSIQSTPGPSGTSSQRFNSRLIPSDSEVDDDTTLRLSNRTTRRRQNSRIQRSTSSHDTTSDSDQADRDDRSVENSNNSKSRKVNGIISSNVKKRKPKKNKDDSDELDAEYEPPKKNSSVNHSTSFSKQNISSLVNKCVYYLLIADQKKYSIKKVDILKNVFCAQNRQLYPKVLEEAVQVLKKTYGMELLSHEHKKGEYLMINILNHDLHIQDFSEHTPSELQKRGLIFYLLTIIFMNEKSITEEELGAALKPLGIDINSKALHPVFGDVYKYLTSELVKQMYLERKLISKDPPSYEYSWGVRANQEVDKKDLLEFACKVMNDTTPEDWILQYRDAINSTRRAEE